MNKKYPDVFNVLRVIALFCVLGLHSKIVISENGGTIFPWFQYTPAWAAMWMFFMMSGFLIGKGFFSGRYDFSKIQGFYKFYKSRFLRVCVPYFLFMLLIFLFVNPVWFGTVGDYTLIKLLFFNYDGRPGITGIGATWFISTIVQLYLLAPFVYQFIFRKIKTNNVAIFIGIGLIIFGLLERIIIRANWENSTYWVYTNVLCNLDVFFVGMLLNKITQNNQDTNIKKWLKPFGWLALIVFILLNSYYLYNGIHWVAYTTYYPTVYLLLYAFILYLYDTVQRVPPSKIDFITVVKNPLRIFDAVALVSFSAYLYHSNIYSVVPKILQANGFPGNASFTAISFFVGTLLVFGFATIMYYIVEKNLNKIRK